MSKKILIIGLGRHGKDTVAEYLNVKYGMSFTSSSMFAAEKFIYGSLKEVLGYGTFQECYCDRHNWRELWYQLIKAYNIKDKARLVKDVLDSGYDIYVGLRDDKELYEAKKQILFDWVLWVDAEERLGVTEDSSSCKVTPSDADKVIYNNGSLEELHHEVDKFMEDNRCLL